MIVNPNNKWVWSGYATILDQRLTHGTKIFQKLSYNKGGINLTKYIKKTSISLTNLVDYEKNQGMQIISMYVKTVY